MRRQIPGDLESIGSGWHRLAMKLHHQLLDEDPQYELGQMKEKWGALRVYIDSSITPRMTEDIYEAELSSERLCETCGESGRVSNVNGWWQTLCDDHYAIVMRLAPGGSRDDRATS